MPGKRKQPQQVYGRLGKHARSFLHDDMFFPSNPDTSQAPPTANTSNQAANKPRSQKEATMASEPSRELIDNVTGFTGMDERTAVRYLKAKHNNADAAINAYFDNEDISKDEAASTWDDGMFSADRDGNDADANRLHLRPPPSAAPTRPSSRASMHPNSKEEEDKDLAEAMAMSQQGMNMSMTSSFHGQQEGGVISGSGVETSAGVGGGGGGGGMAFGPATQEHYDKNQWAMVPRAATVSREIVPDAEAAEQRKNVPGEPRLIKHLPNGDYLANFLTICHAIAGAREALLLRGFERPDYGQSEDWWRGSSVALPRVVQTVDGAPLEDAQDKNDELVAEVQRLTAFLDASERSYASPGALTQTKAIAAADTATATQSGTLLELFMREWVAAAAAKSTTNAGQDLFTTRTQTQDQAEREFLLLDLTTDVPEGEKADLAELMDALFYNPSATSDSDDSQCIEQPADVLVMRLRQTLPNSKQLRVEIPAELYLDKYLRENMAATGGVREQIWKGKERIRKIGEVEGRLRGWKHPVKKGEVIDAKVLLQHAHSHFSGGQSQHDGEVNGVAASSTDEQPTAPPPAHYGEIARKLDGVIARIDAKLAVLAAEKEVTRKAVAEMSRNPLPELEGRMKHHYTLRGVATKGNVTYVLRPKEEDDEDEEMLMEVEDEEGMPLLTGGEQKKDSEDGTPEGMQWWRIEYDVSFSSSSGAGAGARVSKTKTPDYDVLRAVELEHREALVVYATDRVNDIALHNASLPSGLQEFVEKDNALFRQELAGTAYGGPPAYDHVARTAAQFPDIPRQSIERRGSIDSTRAESGEGEHIEDLGPPGYGQDEFMDHPSFGLGPIKQGAYDGGGEEDGDGDGPVVEIQLDEAEPEEEGVGREVGSDAVMEDVGVGHGAAGDMKGMR